MPRSFALVALLAVPVFAAPIPKALLKPKVPLVAGTKWVAEQEASDISPCEFTFHGGGGMTWGYPTRKQAFTDGRWEQTGDTLTYSVNNRYAWTNLTYQDGEFVGTATNVKGKTWKVTLRPEAK
ncbi:MAG: hypothetical protein MUF18_11045 [Fimbriiglobus sp.]|jgi:hypothetical protein|nr:hypothetical protein [Fimbriiglobus sp.]